MNTGDDSLGYSKFKTTCPICDVITEGCGYSPEARAYWLLWHIDLEHRKCVPKWRPGRADRDRDCIICGWKYGDKNGTSHLLMNHTQEELEAACALWQLGQV